MLEAHAELDECRDFLYSAPDESIKPAIIDTRYSNLFLADAADMPNEYDIQQASGVLDTLQGMHLFSKYVPDPETSKSQTLYQLWGRPVLAFSSDCDIEAAN